MTALLNAVAAGILGTIFMDVSNYLLSRIGLILKIDIAMIGRMSAGWARGRFIYRSPAELRPVVRERVLGYVSHYMIGIALALVYVFGWEILVGGAASPAGAVVYGVTTTVISLFVVYPSMGLGLCGLQAPNKTKAALSPVANHLFFGLGMAPALSLVNKVLM